MLQEEQGMTSTAIDTDNRTHADVIAYQEARIEALQRRVEEQAREIERLTTSSVLPASVPRVPTS
jgi:hypothetical protein